MVTCSSTYTPYWTKGGRILTEEKATKISREQLYHEIWEMSVAGVAKKYDANYHDLLKLCKEADIPVPPSGCWVKLQHGKPVEQLGLPASMLSEVTLPGNDKPKRIRKAVAEKSVEKDLDHEELRIHRGFVELTLHKDNKSASAKYYNVTGRRTMGTMLWEKLDN